MTSEMLSAAAGLVLSLLFSYIPGLSDWYEQQTSQVRASIMLVMLLVVTGAAYGLSCTGDFDYFTCDRAGLWQAVELFVLALAANQSIHRITRSI